jgi:RNA polymerase sigma factor for flagellar operon FliA
VSDPRIVSGDGGVDRDQLILDHVPLLRHIAGRMSLDVPGGIDREDLVGYGMVGLIGAADAWDASRGLKFSTFAYTKIRGAILDELRRMDFLPRGRREKVRELDRAMQELEQQLGTKPTPEQLAEALSISIDEVSEIMLSARSACETSLDDGPSQELAALLADPACEDPAGTAEWHEMKSLLAKAILELPDQDQTVINLYYAEGLLLREVSEVLGVTESRASQIHSRAIFRLNRALTESAAASKE